MVDRIRGSIDVPLDARGREEAEKVGRMFASARPEEGSGGIDYLICSDLLRAKQTAEILKKLNPGAQGPMSTPKLRPWHLGEFEGQPTDKVIPKINALMLTPDVNAPGRSKRSTSSGESFNTFADRVLKLVKSLWDFSEEWREDVIVVVTHLRDVKLIESTLPDLDALKVDPKTMQQAGEVPGSVFRMTKTRLVSVRSPKAMGLYLVRHGSTAMNGDQAAS